MTARRSLFNAEGARATRLVAFVLVRARYLCVGGFCASLNWILMLLIDRDHYLLSSMICFPIVGTIGYALHARWTFKTGFSPIAWIAYLVCALPAFPMSIGLLFLLHDLMGIALVRAVPVATLIMFFVNFTIARWTIKGTFSSAPAVPFDASATGALRAR